jgi:hypothetical protein
MRQFEGPEIRVEKLRTQGFSLQMETTKRKGYANATEARLNDYDLAEGNTVDGVRSHVSRACEKGIRMRMPFVRTTAASVLGSRGVVGTTGRGLDWEVRYPWVASGTFHLFSH